MGSGCDWWALPAANCTPRVRFEMHATVQVYQLFSEAPYTVRSATPYPKNDFEEQTHGLVGIQEEKKSC